MKVEFPKFNRCCVCIPLRYGLIIWAYVKLIPNFILLAIMVLSWINNFYSSRTETVLGAFFKFIPIAAILVDIAFNILLLVACHKKHVKLFRIYYYYSIVMIIVFGILMTLNFAYFTYHFAYCASGRYCYIGEFIIFFILLGLMSVNILNFVFQFYLIMLVKSEIAKLVSNATFTFVKIKSTDNTTGTIETNLKAKEEKVRYDRFDNGV